MSERWEPPAPYEEWAAAEPATRRAAKLALGLHQAFPTLPRFYAQNIRGGVSVIAPDGEELRDPTDEDVIRAWMVEHVDFAGHLLTANPQVELDPYWVSLAEEQGLLPEPADAPVITHSPQCQGYPPERPESVPIRNSVPPSGFADDRPALPVFARIEWATGEEVLSARAVAYDVFAQIVKVELDDERCRNRWVWLKARDIRIDDSRPAPRKEGSGR
ncbi:hypothetical protein [Brevibacterium sp.]|uniref:hypothetical protein n=1 Tax=Brevibacterium sp. TaxID=1701 RepID=UPI0025B80363|nr:hypothetical protein [Brevibacterium sp.]